jgi:hypothetical protein
VFGAGGQPVLTNSFTVPPADSDGDGMSDYDEWIAGTNPNDANSALTVIGCELEGGHARITWQGGTNVRQYLERRTTLNNTDTGWLSIYTNRPPTSVSNVYVDTLGADSARFYRIRVQP